MICESVIYWSYLLVVAFVCFCVFLFAVFVCCVFSKEITVSY